MCLTSADWHPSLRSFHPGAAVNAEAVSARTAASAAGPGTLPIKQSTESTLVTVKPATSTAVGLLAPAQQ